MKKMKPNTKTLLIVGALGVAALYAVNKAQAASDARAAKPAAGASQEPDRHPVAAAPEPGNQQIRSRRTRGWPGWPGRCGGPGS